MSQDFAGQNLRGRSFKGQNLEGANFSGADIRSADFTGANLRGANFSHVQAGLQKRWAIFLVCVSWLLSGVSGFFSAFAGVLIAALFNSSSLLNQIGGWSALMMVIVVLIVILRQGFNSVITIAVASTSAFASAVAITSASAFAIALAFASAIASTFAIAIASTFAIPIASAFTIAIAFTSAILIAIPIASPIAIANAIITIASASPIAFAFAIALFSAYIAWRAMKGDEKYALIRDIAVVVASVGGTSFRNANLTDVNFTAATLKSTDFRKANLTRTCFNKTKKLDCVRPGTSYLQKAQVRQVLIVGQGQEKNFDREDLRGVNFQGANLVDASFMGADLSHANLQDADLSRAKLVQTQVNGTDFTGATLTGAYIQDWGITIDTKFTGVRCEYVYMRFPTKENPDPLRKPDNNKEVFADGEFGDFIKPIFDTLDLYHNQGVDPRAIAISFKQLAENYPEAELEIVAMEKRGEDKVLLRAKTSATADKSQLSAEYFDSYNQVKSLPDREVKLLLDEKDSRIRSLENMVITALQKPDFYTGNYHHQGDTKMGEHRNINTGGGTYNEQSGKFGIGNMSGGEIQSGAKVAGVINEAEKQNLAEAAVEIQQLLKQLEQIYPTKTTSQQMVIAAEVVNQIESNPTLKQRVINAVKEGGLAAFEKAIDNPAGAFVVGAIKGWQEVEAEN